MKKKVKVKTQNEKIVETDRDIWHYRSVEMKKILRGRGESGWEFIKNIDRSIGIV